MLARGANGRGKIVRLAETNKLLADEARRFFRQKFGWEDLPEECLPKIYK